MIGEKLYRIDFRIIQGTIQNSFFSGRDFMPNTPVDDWPWFNVMGKNKNDCIDEIVAKLISLKDGVILGSEDV